MKVRESFSFNLTPTVLLQLVSLRFALLRCGRTSSIF